MKFISKKNEDIVSEFDRDLTRNNISMAFIEVEKYDYVVTKMLMNSKTLSYYLSNIPSETKLDPVPYINNGAYDQEDEKIKKNNYNCQHRLWTAYLIVDESVNDNEIIFYGGDTF